MGRDSSRVGVAVALLALALLASPGLSVSREPVVSTTAPNIVLILTDDQQWDSMWAMPNVQSEIADHGVTFSNAFVVNPECCPSRASILTGRYSHSTGVWANSGRHGGFHKFKDTSTVATWLQAAGYSTALMGKYLNGYKSANETYIPPGWSTWDAFVSNGGQGSYFNYSLNENGTVVHYGQDPAAYSTDVLASKADSFIRGAAANQPLFLYFATRAPHQLAVAAPRDAGEYSGIPPLRPPSYNESDVGDKPAWVQGLAPWTPAQQATYDGEYRNAMESLTAVDHAVDIIVQALSDTGRITNTLLVFASDNGMMFGQHRWVGKWAPYEESVRVPLIIRYDPVTSGSAQTTDDHLALNVDWAPTFAAAAGVSAPGAAGKSLLPLLAGTATSWRKRFLIEHLEGGEGVPSYCGVHTADESYVKYTDTGEEELYDLDADPYQLQNVAGNSAYATDLAAMRTVEVKLCRKPPPPPPAGTPKAAVLDASSP